MNAIAPGPIESKLLNAKWLLLPEDETKNGKRAAAERVPLGRIGGPREIYDSLFGYSHG